MSLLAVLVQARSRKVIYISSPQPIRLSEALALAKRSTVAAVRGSLDGEEIAAVRGVRYLENYWLRPAARSSATLSDRSTR
jgi:hypothetical protein